MKRLEPTSSQVVERLALMLLLGGALGCRPHATLPELEDVPQVDPQGLELAVGEQLEAGYAAVAGRLGELKANELSAREPDLQPLGEAFGDLGSMLAAYKYWAQARPAFTNAERLDPAPRWRYYTGHAHRSLGQIEASIEAFERFLNVSPDDVPALVWLGENSLDLGQLDLAQAHFESAAMISPDCVRAHFGLGRVALERGEPTTAIGHLRDANRLQPGSTHVRYALALALSQSGNAVEAKPFFEGSSLDHLSRLPVTMSDPLLDEIHELGRGATSHEHRGLRAAAGGDLRAAVSALQQAVALDPKRVSAWHNLGLALLRTGRRDKAVNELQRLLDRHPHHAPTWVLLGNVAANEGDLVGAEASYRTALETDPGLISARRALMDLLRTTGLSGEAESGQQGSTQP